MSDGGLGDFNAFLQIVENQKQELALKDKTLELEKEKALAARQQDERKFIYAQQQLEAQERDRRDERMYRKTLAEKNFYVLLTLIVAIGIFLTAAIFKNKDQLLIELLKVIAYGGSCGTGAYFWGRHKGNNYDRNPNKSG